MNSFKKLLSVLLVASMMAILVTSCGKSAASGKADKTLVNDVLNLQLTVQPNVLIPQYAVSISDMNITWNIYDGLTEWLSDDALTLGPGLAESWKVSDDGMVYTFFLQKNVKWHNGDKFTANDVAYSFEYMMKSSSTKAKVFAFDHWEVIDEHTIKLYLNTPYPWLLNLFGSFACGIVNKNVIEKYGNVGNSPESICGTGPYKVQEFNPGRGLVLKSNDDYFNGKPRIKTINMKVMNDNSSAFIAFRNGEIDEFLYATVLDVKAVANDEKIAVLHKIKTGNDTLYFNTQKVPLVVRQAINYAVDREAMNQAVVDGAGLPSQMPFPASHAGYRTDIDYEYNPQKAVEMLAAAGYKKGDLTIKLMYPTNNMGPKFATAIQAFIQEIGINVVPESLDYNAAAQRVSTSKDVEMCYWSYGGTPYNPPNIFQSLIRTDAKWNTANFKGPEAVKMDAFINKAMVELDEKKRDELFRDAIKIYREQALSVPCYLQGVNIMHNSKLKGTNYDDVVTWSKYYRYYWEE